MLANPHIKAVFFDVGGVCVKSPLDGVRKYEKKVGLPNNYLNLAIQSRGEQGAFQRLERSEITLSEFYPLFGRECSDPNHVERYKRYCVQKGLAVPHIPRVNVDGEALFQTMMTEASVLETVMTDAIKKLRG
ncbi:hypothetical protein BDK51DRAFT_43155 [Blyttiomyces helicus]|uniref:HAD-like domain-containing protein n=1 Tax=Blyttiomyces helicus TaxID=388810 RepID=A0A4P9W6K3_9FUNG|nr:hypothetical protein BDK51DRAFT_43155 [Blyttiomyces helicus]|eukprot:RKO87954.1 hypothetical protein BDK51DRAFT_43155 [Blyttiomyces helicus]